MTVIIDHAPVSIASGSREFGPVDVPVGTTAFKISLARCTSATPTLWPNATTTIDARIVVAKDGINFDYPAGGMTASGGIVIGPTGNQVAVSSVGPGTFSPPSEAGWKAKAVIAVINGPLVSELTVEVT